MELRSSNAMALVAFDCDPCDPKRRVVIPCLELQEFKDCHAKRIQGLGITVEALIAFAYGKFLKIRRSTRYVQNMIDNVCRTFERIKNLLSWSQPEKTRVVLYVLLCMAFLFLEWNVNSSKDKLLQIFTNSVRERKMQRVHVVLVTR